MSDLSVTIEPLPRRSLWQQTRQYIIPVFSLLGFALIWEIVSRSGAVDDTLLPPPSRVFATLYKLAGPGEGGRPDYLVIKHTLNTLGLLIGGYLISAVLCTVIGVLMGINKRVYEWFNPIVAFFMPIPSFTLVFVFILWVGLGAKTVILTVVVGSCFPILYSAAAGVRSGEQKMIWAAQIAGCSRTQVFFKVLLPGAMGYIITGQKLALGRAWRAVIGAEMFASTDFGLGFMLQDASSFLDTESMFAAIITIGITGLIMENVFFHYLERVTVERWGMVSAKHI
ncbi:MAG: ABC transporter permease [Rhodospirillales bacterium]|nr:ABC transporter permease [Rhodospirillales bacterium]